MGNTCTTVVLPKQPPRILSLTRKSKSIRNPHHSKDGGIISPNYFMATTYDTDDEEEADDLAKLPKFARELIRNLNEEEDLIPNDVIDPILLTKIRPESLTYEFVRENGTKQLFRASSLIDYMLSTGHFHDPETRIPFSDDQLRELDELGTQLEKDSVFLAKQDDGFVIKMEDDEDAFAGVERCAGEHVFEMIRIVERTRKSHAQEMEMELLVRVFPYYRHYVSLMFGLNRDATTVAVDQFKRYLVGPPNRPTVDRTKVLLKFCVDFLDEVMNDLWSAAADEEE